VTPIGFSQSWLSSPPNLTVSPTPLSAPAWPPDTCRNRESRSPLSAQASAARAPLRPTRWCVDQGSAPLLMPCNAPRRSEVDSAQIIVGCRPGKDEIGALGSVGGRVASRAQLAGHLRALFSALRW